MKHRILLSFATGALIGILIILLFSVYIGALTSNDGKFSAVNFFADEAYITTIHGKTGVVVPYKYHDFAGCLSQLYKAVKPEQMSAASSAIGNYSNIEQIVSYASANFTYNEEWRTNYKPLETSMMPTEFLRIKTGVCGDYAFFYAAAALPCFSTVTVRFIEPGSPSSIGHVFVHYNGTALLYKTWTPVTNEMILWYQVYPRGAVLDVVLTYSNSEAHPISVSLWTFTNSVTVTFPATVTKAIITYRISGRTLKVTTKTSYKIYPPVYGQKTIINNTITIYDGDYTYYISNSLFGAAKNDVTFIVHYYGEGTTEYYYGLKK